MIPRLYDASFDTSGYLSRNGYGFFDRCFKCEVTEERNGNYFLEMTVDASDRLAAVVAPNRFVKAMANHRDPPQLFEINEVRRAASGDINIQAQHIKFLCYQNYLSNYYNDVDEEGTAQEIGRKFLISYPALSNRFSFYSDIPDIRYLDTSDAAAKTFGELLGDESGGLLATFGGEYHYDNFRIDLLKKRGVNTVHKLVFGANLSDFEQTASNDVAYTHIVGTAKVKRSDSPASKTFSGTPYQTGVSRVFQKVLRVDLTSELQAIYGADMKINLTSGSTPFPNVPSDLTVQKIKDSLTALTQEYYNKHRLYHEALTVGMTVTYEPFLQQLSDVWLCDTLKVVIGGALTTTAKVTKVVFDSLAERCTSLTIGEPTVSLSNFIKEKRR